MSAAANGAGTKRALAWVLAVIIGMVFLLPHVVRIVELGSYAAYSPFSARTLSPMVFDETFLYAAETNYTLTRGAPGYDDTWEHRKDVYPYSVLPTSLEAGMAAVLGSLKLAHIAGSFLFPCLSALLLAGIFVRAGAGRVMASALALLTLVMAFSPMTLVRGVQAFLLHGRGARVFDTLQAARDPNPGMTFPLFMACLLLLALVLRSSGGGFSGTARRALRWAAAAGAMGGLLYFSYIYYAIAWTVALGVLAVAAAARRVPRTVWLTLAVTAVFAVAFLAWQHSARVHGNYLARATRIGLYHLHEMAPGSLGETEFWAAWAVLCALGWMWVRRGRGSPETAYLDALMPVLLAAMTGGLVGMNMQLVTGFNVQQVQHYPHMVLQPVGFLMLGALVARASRDNRLWRAAGWAGFGLLLVTAGMAQVEAGRDSAPMHAVPRGEVALFAWLNANSEVGSVVATNDLELSVMLPAMTHNSVLYAHGSRSSAGDDELMERLLLVDRLEGVSSAELAGQLEGRLPPDHDVHLTDYPFYLYEFSATYQPFRAARRVRPELIPVLVRQYEAMDLALELERFRVDYVWTPGAAPPAVPGWGYAPVFSTDRGRLWRLMKTPEPL